MLDPIEIYSSCRIQFACSYTLRHLTRGSNKKEAEGPTRAVQNMPLYSNNVICFTFQGAVRQWGNTDGNYDVMFENPKLHIHEKSSCHYGHCSAKGKKYQLSGKLKTFYF